MIIEVNDLINFDILMKVIDLTKIRFLANFYKYALSRLFIGSMTVVVYEYYTGLWQGTKALNLLTESLETECESRLPSLMLKLKEKKGEINLRR